MPFPMPTPTTLSARQAALVRCIDTLTRERGFAPSIRECAAAMDLHPSRIGQLVHTAAAKGAVAFEPGVARSLRVVQQPAQQIPTKAAPKRCLRR